MQTSSSIGVLFVCLGNICRSPAAEGAFRHAAVKRKLLDHFRIDSCGIAAYHVGKLAHSSTRSVAARYGIHLNSRARQFQPNDFERFQYILAMDRDNYESLLQYTHSAKQRQAIRLFRSFDPEVNSDKKIPDVPDPYYGGIAGFERVQEIVLRTAENFLEQLMPLRSK